MILNDFMKNNFTNLELTPPLFYSWDICIRFELGVEWKREYDYPNNPYIKGCYKRAIILFEALHSPSDDIFIVIDVIDFDKGKNIKHKLRNFSRYVKRSLLYSLKYQRFLEDDIDGTCETHRFTLNCKTFEFKYIPLLKAICNQDLGIKPSISHRVYFINPLNKTIFHVYDDRGCDLLATSPKAIRDVYNKYNNWILDYDRNKIDLVFK